MKPIDAKETGIFPEALADAQLVAECVAAGRLIPAEVVRRVHEEAQKIGQRIPATARPFDI